MQIGLTISSLLFLIMGVFALSLLINALRNLRVYKFADYLLVIFSGLFFLLTGILGGGELGWLEGLDPELRYHLPWISVILMSAVFYALTISVFSKRRLRWSWIILCLALIGAAVFLDTSDILREFSKVSVSTILLLAGWGGYQAALVIYLLRAYRQTERQTIRLRCLFWTASLIFFIGSSIMILMGKFLGGVFLLTLASLIINYLVITYRLPDLRVVIMQVVSHGLTGITTVLVFAVVFLLLERGFRNMIWYRSVYNGAFNLLLGLVLYNPFNYLVKSILEKLIIRESDRTLEIRNYSKALSSILDIDLLSKVTIEMICETLDIREGVLYLVDPLESEQGAGNFRLRSVEISENSYPDLDFLPVNNPITRVLVEDKRPLTQSELEYIPRFQTIPENILVWINSLEVEALVPIHTDDEWIGLFALSQKKNGASFTDKELEFLGTIGDQTSVALQNARLVESLTNIDNQLRRVKASKNTALDKIERIKKSASDIISIKAHELRSALTVMSGYGQLMANTEELMENSEYAELIRGLLAGLDKLEAVIDSMMYSANVKPSSLDIGTRPISLYSIVDGICRDLQENVQARKITLSHDGLAEIPPVYGDAAALRKVFRILILYAMTHTPSGGKIRITGRHIPPRSEVLKWEGAEVVVCDTGIGINPDDQGAFFQEQSLGDELERYLSEEHPEAEGVPADQLAIVRGVIEAHNGRVWVERTAKDTEHLPGSEFHVVLPLEQQSYPTQKVKGI